MICENVLCTLRNSASSSGEGSTTSGSSVDLGDQVRLALDEVAELHALRALDEDPQRAVGHLDHARDRARHAHAVELVGAGVLDLRVARGDHHEHAVAAEHVVHEPDRALLPDGERGERVREGDAVLQRQDRQRLGQRASTSSSCGLAVARRDLDRRSGASRLPRLLDRAPAGAAPRAWRAGPPPRRMPSS